MAIGEPMVEFNETEPEAGRFLRGFGGDTSNFLIAAARQGGRTAYVSALGDDRFGAELRALWTREGVGHTAVRTDRDAFTAIYFVNHDASGHHFSFYRQGSAASRYRPADLPEDLIAGARVLHLSGISLALSATACDACYAAVALARKAGAAVSFDTNLRLRLWGRDRATAIITDMIGRCDICLPSYDDIVALWNIADADAIVDRCLALGARTVALKLGAAGALVADGRERHRIPPFPCRPVDATGAGDAFGGAFVTRRLAGDSLAEAGRYAACVAALSTEGYGAVDPIPVAATVMSRLVSR